MSERRAHGLGQRYLAVPETVSRGTLWLITSINLVCMAHFQASPSVTKGVDNVVRRLLTSRDRCCPNGE